MKIDSYTPGAKAAGQVAAVIDGATPAERRQVARHFGAAVNANTRRPFVNHGTDLDAVQVVTGADAARRLNRVGNALLILGHEPTVQPATRPGKRIVVLVKAVGTEGTITHGGKAHLGTDSRGRKHWRTDPKQAGRESKGDDDRAASEPRDPVKAFAKIGIEVTEEKAQKSGQTYHGFAGNTYEQLAQFRALKEQRLVWGFRKAGKFMWACKPESLEKVTEAFHGPAEGGGGQAAEGATQAGPSPTGSRSDRGGDGGGGAQPQRGEQRGVPEGASDGGKRQAQDGRRPAGDGDRVGGLTPEQRANARGVVGDAAELRAEYLDEQGLAPRLIEKLPKSVRDALDEEYLKWLDAKKPDVDPEPKKEPKKEPAKAEAEKKAPPTDAELKELKQKVTDLAMRRSEFENRRPRPNREEQAKFAIAQQRTRTDYGEALSRAGAAMRAKKDAPAATKFSDDPKIDHAAQKVKGQFASEAGSLSAGYEAWAKKTAYRDADKAKVKAALGLSGPNEKPERKDEPKSKPAAATKKDEGDGSIKRGGKAHLGLDALGRKHWVTAEEIAKIPPAELASSKLDYPDFMKRRGLTVDQINELPVGDRQQLRREWGEWAMAFQRAQAEQPSRPVDAKTATLMEKFKALDPALLRHMVTLHDMGAKFTGGETGTLRLDVARPGSLPHPEFAAEVSGLAVIAAANGFETVRFNTAQGDLVGVRLQVPEKPATSGGAKAPEAQRVKSADELDAERPATFVSYDAGGKDYQVDEGEFVAKEHERAVKRAQQSAEGWVRRRDELPPRKTPTKWGDSPREQAESNAKYWEKESSRLAATDGPTEAEQARSREKYSKIVKLALGKGLPVPHAVIDQRPEFKKARNARRSYEKGRHTSFGNDSIAVRRDLVEDHGVKVKRQDGKALTAAQIKHVADGVREVEEALGPLGNVFRNLDLTIAHTGGKHPFLSHYGGLFVPSERTVSIGINNRRGEPIPALAHELAHLLDFEAGKSMGKSTAKWTGGMKKRYLTTSLAEAEAYGRTSKLIELATSRISNTYQVKRALKAKLKDQETTDDLVEVEEVKVRLGPYWREPSEVLARLVEQYVTTVRGGGVASSDDYNNSPGWWSDEDFEELAPMVREAIATRIAALGGDPSKVAAPPMKKAGTWRRVTHWLGSFFARNEERPAPMTKAVQPRTVVLVRIPKEQRA